MEQSCIEYTEDELIADLKATYPGIHARPGREFKDDLDGMVWTGGEAEMPNGHAIFDGCSYGEDYDGYVHIGFTHWLEKRGWYLEHYDGGVFLACQIKRAKNLGGA